MGIDAWNTFVLRVESLDMGEPTFHAEKTACYRLQQQTKVRVLALDYKLLSKTEQKALNKGYNTQNQTISLSIYIIRLLSASELV